MRLILIVTRLGAGGPPVAILNLHRALLSQGHESVLVIGECEDSELSAEYLLSSRDAVVRVPQMRRSINLVADMLAFVKLFQLCWKFKPNVVHTHTAKAGALGRLAAFLAGVPTIVHTYHGNVLKGYFPRWKTSIFRVVEGLLGAITTAVVVLSEQQRLEIVTELKIVKRSRCIVIPLGLDLVSRHPHSGKTTGGDTIIVGWAGRFVEIKNLPLLVDVIRGWPEHLGKVAFLVAGAGPAGRQLSDTGFPGAVSVELLGWLVDPNPFYDRLDCLLLTSHNEGTPIVLLEAMARRIPTISTGVGGVPDLMGPVVERLDDDVVVCERGVMIGFSASSAHSAILWVKSNKPVVAEMCQRALLYVSATYSVSAMVDRNMAVYGLESER